MASPNTTYTELVATTLAGYSGVMADNVTNHNALLRWLNKKGNMSRASGREIVQELEYAENGTVGWYVGSESFDISQTQVMTAAAYSWKQIAGAVVINGLEEVQNSGREAVHNLLKARLKNLERSMANDIATGLYATGTGNDGKEFGGLQLVVADAPANTVGGIDASTYTWWQNYEYDFSDESATPGSDTIQTAMNTTWVNVIRGTDKPDVITADSVYWIYYLESLQTNQRFTDDKRAGAGFPNVVYMGNVPVIYDDQAPASHMYMLNTDYLFCRKSSRWLQPLKDRASINQDAIVMPMVADGNITCSNRARQGVINA